MDETGINDPFLCGGDQTSSNGSWLICRFFGPILVTKLRLPMCIGDLACIDLGSFPGKSPGKKVQFVEAWGGSGYVEGGLTGLPAGRQESVGCGFLGCKFWGVWSIIRNFPTGFLGANAFWADEISQCLSVAQKISAMWHTPKNPDPSLMRIGLMVSIPSQNRSIYIYISIG